MNMNPMVYLLILITVFTSTLVGCEEATKRNHISLSESTVTPKERIEPSSDKQFTKSESITLATISPEPTVSILPSTPYTNLYRPNSANAVSVSPDGRPVDPDQATHDFTDIVRQTDLPPMTLHDLRHCHATDQLKKGIDAKIVSERLGHSTIGITMDIYSHVLTGMQKEAADSIEEGLEITLK